MDPAAEGFLEGCVIGEEGNGEGGKGLMGVFVVT